MYSAYWRHTLHYDSPACFSCSIVSFEGSGFFSCVSVFFNFDLSNFSISAISGLSDMVAEGAAGTKPRGWGWATYPSSFWAQKMRSAFLSPAWRHTFNSFHFHSGLNIFLFLLGKKKSAFPLPLGFQNARGQIGKTAHVLEAESLASVKLITAD